MFTVEIKAQKNTAHELHLSETVEFKTFLQYKTICIHLIVQQLTPYTMTCVHCLCIYYDGLLNVEAESD